MIGDCQLCKLSDICKYIYAECCPYIKSEYNLEVTIPSDSLPDD